MESRESKKLTLIRILQILEQHSDADHLLKQEEIAAYLERDFGITLERKAVGRNLSFLKEAGYEIETVGKSGSYLVDRTFDDSELRMLIDAVLCSKHITARHSSDLIARLCGLSNRYFRSHVKNICSVNEWSKSDNQELFLNISIIDDAIEQGRQIRYSYNKFGTDKKLHKTSTQYVSPYQMILHNQRYYLMAYSEYWKNMTFHRLDHITDMEIVDEPATRLETIPGYENGIDYRELSTSLPYMYTDPKERVEFLADPAIVDQIVDWFGSEAAITKGDDGRVRVNIKVSPTAMEYWAMQYMSYVEVTSPPSLREKLRDNLARGMEKYR